MRKNERTVLQRFFEYVQVTEGCWLWTGSVNNKGYGQFYFEGRPVLAHRLLFDLSQGLHAGYELDHLCRTPRCVNVDHLEEVTHAENVRRGDAGSNSRAKTHCPSGHPLVASNLVKAAWEKKGHRLCLTCQRVHQRAYDHAHLAEHLERQRERRARQRHGVA